MLWNFEYQPYITTEWLHDTSPPQKIIQKICLTKNHLQVTDFPPLHPLHDSMHCHGNTTSSALGPWPRPSQSPWRRRRWDRWHPAPGTIPQGSPGRTTRCRNGTPGFSSANGPPMFGPKKGGLEVLIRFNVWGTFYNYTFQIFINIPDMFCSGMYSKKYWMVAKTYQI